jgi:F0F1-type ATP synthase membrane subunit b/b'
MIMNEFKQWAVNHRLSRMVVTFFVGFLLLLNVACSPATATTAPKVTGESSSTEKQGFQTELYDATQDKRGGMNGFDDDVRAGTPSAKAKAKALVDNARRNVKQPAENLKEIPKKVRQSAEEIQDNISDRAEQQKDDLVKGTKRGMKNLKGNLDKASKEIPEVVREATEGAKDNVMRSADSARETVDTLQRNVDRSVNIN